MYGIYFSRGCYFFDKEFGSFVKNWENIIIMEMEESLCVSCGKTYMINYEVASRLKFHAMTCNQLTKIIKKVSYW